MVKIIIATKPLLTLKKKIVIDAYEARFSDINTSLISNSKPNS